MSRLEAGNRTCIARTVTETQLEQVVIDAINMLMGNRDNILETLQHNLEAVISDTSSMDARLDELQQELPRTAKNDEAYDTIVDEIYRLREEKEQTCVNAAKRDEQKWRVAELRGFIMSQSNKAIAFDEGLVKRMVSSITVFADRFVVKFKSGVIVDIIG